MTKKHRKINSTLKKKMIVNICHLKLCGVAGMQTACTQATVSLQLFRPVPEKGVLGPKDLAGEEVKHQCNVQCVKENAH